MSDSSAFILCTEGGAIEPESLLMVESFLRYAGNFDIACRLYRLLAIPWQSR